MNVIQRNLARIRLFITRASLIGISAPRALLWDLPRVVAWRAYSRAASVLYAFVDQHRWADKSIKRSLQQITDDKGIYFYVIVVPQVLHFLIPAVRLVQQHIKIVFVLNGITADEEHVLRRAFPGIQTLRLRTLPKSNWSHGHLLSLLLRNSKRDFGIIDHDFFLFEPSVFKQLTFRENEFAVCATAWRNSLTEKEFPGTHFLYLRVDLLRDVMQRYEVGAQLYKRIPANVKPLLREMGLTLDNPPKEYQSFFDSFLLLSALAMHDGFEIRKLDIADDDWTHVGGTSIGLQVTKEAVHHYVSFQFMALLSDTAIAEEYHQKILTIPDKAQLLRKSLDPVIAARIETLVDRVASAI